MSIYIFLEGLFDAIMLVTADTSGTSLLPSPSSSRTGALWRISLLGPSTRAGLNKSDFCPARNPPLRLVEDAVDPLAGVLPWNFAFVDYSLWRLRIPPRPEAAQHHKFTSDTTRRQATSRRGLIIPSVACSLLWVSGTNELVCTNAMSHVCV